MALWPIAFITPSKGAFDQIFRISVQWTVTQDICQQLVENRSESLLITTIFAELPCANNGRPSRFGWPVNSNACVCSWQGHSVELQTDLGSATHSWKIEQMGIQHNTRGIGNIRKNKQTGLNITLMEQWFCRCCHCSKSPPSPQHSPLGSESTFP